MPTERELLEQAFADLEEAGYIYVEREATSGRPGSRVRADLIAYGPNTEGEVAPVVLVEIKGGQSGAASTWLSQLASLSNVFGTEHSYVFDGSWHKASPGFTGLIEVAGPEPAGEVGSDTKTPVAAFYSWLSRDLWHRADQIRNRESSWIELLGSVLSEKEVAQSRDLALWKSTGTSAFWAVARLMEERQLPRSAGEYFVPRDVALALGRLLAPRDGAAIVDPYCGAGSLLWASREIAEKDGRGVRLEGFDRNETSINLARSFGSLIGIQGANFAVGDWLLDSGTEPGLDYLLSAPPMGMRLADHIALPWGSETTDGDVAVLAKAALSLNPGGRAVILMSRKVLSASGPALRLREWLGANRRVTALIGLPPGIFLATSIPTVIIVVENTAPTETLVAELQEDWARQLSATGAFMAEYREHIA